MRWPERVEGRPVLGPRRNETRGRAQRSGPIRPVLGKAGPKVAECSGLGWTMT